MLNISGTVADSKMLSSAFECHVRRLFMPNGIYLGPVMLTQRRAQHGGILRSLDIGETARFRQCRKNASF